MHSTRPLWQLEERVRNHLKLVSNTILAIMRPGCLILTATILRSSIKASRRQNIVHQGGATSCWLNTSRSRSSFTPYTEHLNLIVKWERGLSPASSPSYDRAGFGWSGPQTWSA